MTVGKTALGGNELVVITRRVRGAVTDTVARTPRIHVQPHRASDFAFACLFSAGRATYGLRAKATCPSHRRLQYKPEATPEQIKQVTDAFRDLQKKIPGITAFEDGVNNSPEKKNLGFTHVTC